MTCIWGKARYTSVTVGGVFRILDMGTGGYRLTMLRDVAHTATLVDHLDYIRFYIIACQAHDLEPQNYHHGNQILAEVVQVTFDGSD
ncbi:unnamed protein product [marine sediment metagenome]|uniref:Uncharacterized protein n=1 Tax=marine sediment metagenome TaxID=412755 RepID=X1A7I2_9ZZZZ